MRTHRPTTTALAAVLLGVGALVIAGCGSGGADGEHLSRDLLIYSSTTFVPMRSSTTTSTTTTTAPPAPTSSPATTALKLPPLPPPTAGVPLPPSAVQRAADRASGLETVLGDVERAVGEIDGGMADIEDQS